ncbi:MAG: hypothetical protein O9338_21365 [Microcystis sp. LE19-251.1A]|jgi:hypothetical protein|nr:hypothetical protein [Cytophagales bacterium]MCZ8365200.1 hypothetical protein [Microcystis sp. LE19-251.1A]
MKRTPNTYFKYNHVVAFILYVVATVFFDSCQTTEEVNPAVPARQWFEQNLGTQSWDAWPYGTTVQSIDWSSAITNADVTEVPLRVQGQVTGHLYNRKVDTEGESYFRLVLWPEKDGYDAAVIQLIPENGKVPRHLGEIKQSEFSGLVLANRGGGRKYATLFSNGKSQENSNLSGARTESWQCFTVCHRATITVGNYSSTTLYCDDYCYYYDDTQWQVPMPPEGGGGGEWVFDYGSVIGGGGSSSGPWTSAFPTNPSNGDLFELTDPSGIVTKYIYNSSTNAWEVYEVTLPVGAVTVQADRYPFLQNSVPSGFIVIGTDGFIYEYTGTNWIGIPVSICPANFNFVSVTTNNLWQEAAISNAYVRLVYSGTSFTNITVNLPTLYFGLPYYNIEGNLVYSPWQAKDIATRAYNEAERDLVNYFKEYPYMTEAHYQNYWLGQMQYHVSIRTAGLGRIGTSGSINPSNPVIPVIFVPCRP